MTPTHCRRVCFWDALELLRWNTVSKLSLRRTRTGRQRRATVYCFIRAGMAGPHTVRRGGIYTAAGGRQAISQSALMVCMLGQDSLSISRAPGRTMRMVRKTAASDIRMLRHTCKRHRLLALPALLRCACRTFLPRLPLPRRATVRFSVSFPHYSKFCLR